MSVWGSNSKLMWSWPLQDETFVTHHGWHAVTFTDHLIGLTDYSWIQIFKMHERDGFHKNVSISGHHFWFQDLQMCSGPSLLKQMVPYCCLYTFMRAAFLASEKYWDQPLLTLTHGSLNACMKLNLTTHGPDYKTISKTIPHYKWHLW